MKRIFDHSDGWEIFRYIEISIRKHKDARAGPVARRKMQMALKLASGPAVTTQDASSPLNVSRTSEGVRLGCFELGLDVKLNHIIG